MKKLGSILRQTVSATLVASLVSGTYGSLAFADQPSVSSNEQRSCRLVVAETYLKDHEARLSADIKPVVRDIALNARNTAFLLLSKIRKPLTWSEETYLAKYAEVRGSLEQKKEVALTDYQSPEALLAVWDAASERARAESGIFQGDFSFGAMMRNASPATRTMMLRNLTAALDSKGYKSWKASDAMINLYLLAKDPGDRLGFVLAHGEGQAIRQVIQTRLEAQILRRELGSVLTEIGIGRADEPMKDLLIKGWLVARKYASNVMWTALILHGALPAQLSVAALNSTALSGLEAASIMPIGDITRTRAPLTPKMEELLKTKQDMDQLWSQIPVQDKMKAAAQIKLKMGQYIAVRIMTLAIFALILNQFWKWKKPELRRDNPELADILSLPRPWMKRADLEADVYKKWQSDYVKLDPNIDQSPVAADVRKQIHAESSAALGDFVYNDATASDIGIKAKMTPEQMRAAERTIDENPDGTDNSPYADLPRFSE